MCALIAELASHKLATFKDMQKRAHKEKQLTNAQTSGTKLRRRFMKERSTNTKLQQQRLAGLSARASCWIAGGRL